MHWTRVVFIAAGLGVGSAEEEVIFRSDVSLVRVDVQVLDRNRNAVTRLAREDFVLREEGRVTEIRNFAAENMPVDILMLLDVSGSMRPHLEQVARASSRALQVLSKDDRVGVMVFDRATRLRSPFRPNPESAARELDFLLQQESFNGGTDITRALVDAARYVERNARADARRAIMIVTDDRTEFDRDEARVTRALASADAVLSVLVANPIEPGFSRGGGQYPAPGRRSGGPRQRGGTWPGGGGGSRWPGGGGTQWPGGGGTQWPGGGTQWPGGGGTQWPGGGSPRGGGQIPVGDRTRSAGTEEIARDSGGDSLSLSEASSVERTLERIRNRYAIYFLLPAEAREGEQRTVDVQLSSAASARYAEADVRMRRRYLVPALGPRSTTPETAAPSVLSSGAPRPASGEAHSGAEGPSEGGFRRATAADIAAAAEAPVTTNRRKRAVSEPGASRGPNPSLGAPPKP